MPRARAQERGTVLCGKLSSHGSRDPTRGVDITTQAPKLPNLSQISLRQQALEILRRAITSGQIAPGTRLIETELSAQLGISRGTLREALRSLHQQGLLTLTSTRGMAVRSLDAREVRDIFRVRAALESLAARLLSESEERARFATTLRDFLSHMEESQGIPLEERIESDLGFHRTLCELTGNTTLVQTWVALEGPIRMTFAWSGLEKTVGNMRASRHEAVIHAIEGGNPEAARNAVESHMEEAANNLVSGARQKS